MGCDLFFCERHQCVDFEKHWDWEPKPDIKRWMQFMLDDESWAPWRAKHPAEVAMMIKEVASGDA